MWRRRNSHQAHKSLICICATMPTCELRHVFRHVFEKYPPVLLDLSHWQKSLHGLGLVAYLINAHIKRCGARVVWRVCRNKTSPAALWGSPEWNGRLTFPSRETSAASPSKQIIGATRPIPNRSGQEVRSEHSDLTKPMGKV